jgi:hypothetical protein
MPSCSACVKAGIECERALQVRFRPGLGPSAGYAFSSDQVWVRPRQSCMYCPNLLVGLGLGLMVAVEYRDETTQVSQNYETDEVQE